jgi:hypothetical protein
MQRNGALVSRQEMDRMRQVRSEIGRRLREHYDADLRPLPDRLAELVRKIEHANGLCEKGLADEQAARLSGERARVRADGADFPYSRREGRVTPDGAAMAQHDSEDRTH